VGEALRQSYATHRCGVLASGLTRVAGFGDADRHRDPGLGDYDFPMLRTSAFVTVVDPAWRCSE